MTGYSINRGIGQPPEFKGLQSQDLFIFAGGLLAVFVVLAIMFMAGANHWACLVFGGGTGTALVRTVFSMNRRYGAYGLMKARAKMSRPRFIVNRRRFAELLSLGKAGRDFHKTSASCETD